MRKLIYAFCAIAVISLSVFARGNEATNNLTTTLANAEGDPSYTMKTVTVNVKGLHGTVKKTYKVADINDVSHVYVKSGEYNRNKCFFVVSKKEFRLYVYEDKGADTVLLAHYPICYGKNRGPKTRSGDMSTPECSEKAPCTIMQIQDYSKKKHDFGDGRGSILAYGHWFMRLDLSKSDCARGCRSNQSIGIHGSTNNAASVPGCDSEGCIRLRDADINQLHDMFAHVGTRVIIKSATRGKLGFETRAQNKLGAAYQHAHQGYKQP